MPVLTADTRMAGEFRSNSEGGKTLFSMSNRLWRSKLRDSAPPGGTGRGEEVEVEEIGWLMMAMLRSRTRSIYIGIVILRALFSG